MATTRKIKSKILQNAHVTAKGLHKIGVMDKVTMRKFDVLCLPEVKFLTPAQIISLRKKAGVSQTVFALYLNTSPSSLRQWEQGDTKPTGTALKLLNLVQDKGLEVLV